MSRQYTSFPQCTPVSPDQAGQAPEVHTLLAAEVLGIYNAIHALGTDTTPEPVTQMTPAIKTWALKHSKEVAGNWPTASFVGNVLVLTNENPKPAAVTSSGKTASSGANEKISYAEASQRKSA